MEDNELNNLIVLFKSGDETALESLCREFLPSVTQMSENVWYKLHNNADFECRCLTQLKRALMKFDETKGKARSLISHVLVKERSVYLNGKRGKRLLETSSFEELVKVNKDGKEEKFDCEDVLANVEDQVLNKDSVKERAALLAQGDPVKIEILNAWQDGIYDDSKLSRLLAQSFNGKSESYRKTIHRFRIKCRKSLENSIQ